jgi:hypothetical protein
MKTQLSAQPFFFGRRKREKRKFLTEDGREIRRGKGEPRGVHGCAIS